MIYDGSCFCGVVWFQVDGDLVDGMMCCNCCFCCKMCYWEMCLFDLDGFWLMFGVEYVVQMFCVQDDGMNMYYNFCVYCGMWLWIEGDIFEMGGCFVMVCINVLDVFEVDLVIVLIFYVDGVYDNWQNLVCEMWYL